MAPDVFDRVRYSRARRRNHRQEVHVLLLRWKAEIATWVYDDPSVGVWDEPLVCGADDMVTALADRIAPALYQLRLSFSSGPIPGAIAARLVEDLSGLRYGSGATYAITFDGVTMIGWLCSKLLDYFPHAPERIYVRGEALPTSQGGTR